ncbi:MAG: T9SS type A sorting domain-containing protein [Ignavibacteria bacterium]|nr:T9SS type A sorting domain-containing protein [Ignavibacteria bacterium]
MRKSVLLALVILLFPAVTEAQTFEFTPNHTVLNDSLGSELVFEFTFRNLTNSPQTIYIVRTQENLPHQDWTSSMCFDLGCFAPFVDSVATTPDFSSSPLQPMETRDFSVHIFTSTINGTATVTVKAVNMNQPAEFYTVELTGRTIPVSVEDAAIVTGFRLDQNFPNPFNPSTSISFKLAKSSDVSLTVYNSLGIKVKEVLNGYMVEGEHRVNIDASDLSSGVYFYQLNAGDLVTTRKMILEK